MNSRNKKLLLILVVLMLFVSIGKETYALFTSEVSSIVQNFGTGTLKLSYSNTTINLDNVYPMSDTDGMNIADTSITITNVGTLAYKFNVILEPTSSSTLDSSLIKVSMDGESPAILSSDSNIIIRDVILNPGSSRTFTIKLWIPNTVSSSDILGKKFNASLTSSGIAVKDVEDSDGAVLAGPIPLYDYIKNNANTTTQIDFSKTSKESNTNGIYMTTNTDSGKPVYYYRGAVDNNVLFANFCWKIIRTTETGGVKLIYNGVQKDGYNSYQNLEESDYTIITNDTTYPYVFDNTNKVWKSNNTDDSGNGNENIIEISVKSSGSYQLNILINNESGDDIMELYLNDNYIGYGDNCGEGCFAYNDTDTINISLNTSDVIKVVYYKFSTTTDGSDYVQFNLQKGIGDLVKSCNNTGVDSTIGNYQFNSSYDSPAYVGYMYNTVYASSGNKSMSNQTGTLIFGNDIDYDASANQYTLKDTYTLTDASNWKSEYTTIASKYHYTCLTSDNTCTSVYYMHDMFSSGIYYFALTNGKNHLDILEEMLNSADINTKDSTIKTALDTWYQNNMTSYTSKLEDTVFCNDRGYNEKLNTSSWNKDYSATTGYLYFNSNSRLSSYKPSLVCSRTIDKFTTNSINGNGKLTYPIGLITADEAAYAGGIYGTTNSSYYLYNGDYQWTFSPSSFNSSVARGFFLTSAGGLYYYLVVDASVGARPVVSLKPGIGYSSGSGTASSPFVVN